MEVTKKVQIDMSLLTKEQVHTLKAHYMLHTLGAIDVADETSDLQKSRGVIRLRDFTLSDSIVTVDYVLYSNGILRRIQTVDGYADNAGILYKFKKNTPLHKKLEKVMKYVLMFRNREERRELWEDIRTWESVFGKQAVAKLTGEGYIPAW